MSVSADAIEIQIKNVQRRGSSTVSFDLTAFLSDAWSLAIVHPSSGRVYFEKFPGAQNSYVRARGVTVGTGRPQMVFSRHHEEGRGVHAVVVQDAASIALIDLVDAHPRIVSSNANIRLRH